jgi:D-glycero-D-manno-heptose 1,7-bisphosphate phosphatase
MTKNKAVFLDRDGTIIREQYGVYITKPNQVELIDGAALGIKELRKAGYKIIVITNQGGIDLGFITKEELVDINSEMILQLEQSSGIGVPIDDIYFCPHHPKVQSCNCRKPSPLLVEMACGAYEIDVLQSWFVGDRADDIMCGSNAGCRTVLVMTGEGRRSVDYLYWCDQAEHLVTAKNLYAATRFIINTDRR